MAAHYLEPYENAQEQFGTDFAVTLWAGPETQHRRFAVIADMVDLTDRTIVDAGCGRGDLAAWMHDAGIDFKHYLGIDALDDVITFARERELVGTDFQVADLLADPDILAGAGADVIIFSGSLNTMKPDEVQTLLDAAWRATGQTLVFNFLSDLCTDRAPKDTGPARRFDTVQWLKWAADRTPAIRYRQDYLDHGHDATIAMHRLPEHD
ncbi:MAG: class I SAM-dependent methyltransferase [Phycisphaeraceae bacterium]|nr:class I SAM-dependent methyltransferase [Phycisphaeraceae bacterium]